MTLMALFDKVAEDKIEWERNIRMNKLRGLGSWGREGKTNLTDSSDLTDRNRHCNFTDSSRKQSMF